METEFAVKDLVSTVKEDQRVIGNVIRVLRYPEAMDRFLAKRWTKSPVMPPETLLMVAWQDEEDPHPKAVPILARYCQKVKTTR